MAPSFKKHLSGHESLHLIALKQKPNATPCSRCGGGFVVYTVRLHCRCRFFRETTHGGYVEKSLTVKVQQFYCVSLAADCSKKSSNSFVPEGPINGIFVVFQRFLTFFSNGKSY